MTGTAEFELLMAADLTAEEVVAQLIDRAVALPASDLFFSAYEDHARVTVRHLGILKLLLKAPRDEVGLLRSTRVRRFGETAITLYRRGQGGLAAAD
jgi:type II secretory ATPase GspE/PulE/Tfp pilus assembly ATPase PilB-like protein